MWGGSWEKEKKKLEGFFSVTSKCGIEWFLQKFTG